MLRILLAGLLALTLSGIAAPAQTRPPLRENPTINEPLFAGFVGDAIRKNCESISGRVALALSRLYDLRDEALRQGYSRAEIRAYVTSDTERDRMEARRDTYLAANGVRRGDAESYCALGRREIAAKSAIGELLRLR